MGGLDVVDTADVRVGDGGQSGDLAGRVHTHLEDGQAVAGLDGEQRQRQADEVVEVAPGLEQRVDAGVHTGQGLGEDGRNQLLDRGFAGTAGDRGHLQSRREESTAVRGQRPQGLEGVVDLDSEHLRRQPLG